jgi:hypothetical protein
MAQQRIAGRDEFQQMRCAVHCPAAIEQSSRGAILDIGTLNSKTDQQAHGVSDDVTFAAFDPLLLPGC